MLSSIWLIWYFSFIQFRGPWIQPLTEFLDSGIVLTRLFTSIHSYRKFVVLAVGCRYLRIRCLHKPISTLQLFIDNNSTAVPSRYDHYYFNFLVRNSWFKLKAFFESWPCIKGLHPRFCHHQFNGFSFYHQQNMIA